MRTIIWIPTSIGYETIKDFLLNQLFHRAMVESPALPEVAGGFDFSNYLR